MNISIANKLKLEPYQTAAMPQLVTANGTPLSVAGLVKCNVSVGDFQTEHEFIVCNDQIRPLILGRDFLSANHAGVNWGPGGRQTFLVNGTAVVHSSESVDHISLKIDKSLRIPPRTIASVFVKPQDQMEGKYDIHSNNLLQSRYPNLACFPTSIDTSDTEAEPAEPTTFPVPLVNLSHTENVYLRKGQVVALATKLNGDINLLHDNPIPKCRNWVPPPESKQYIALDLNEIREAADIVHTELIQPQFMKAELAERSDDPDEQGKEYHSQDPGIVPISSDFILSPADVEEYRKVDLKNRNIMESTKRAFRELCEQYDAVFSKDNKDIGLTHLTKMNIDTGDHYPVAQRPYTLALKHHDWVKQEIETLLEAGIIEDSISPWASPIVVVPKKSAPGEPPRRRLCVDFRKLNELQPRVDKAHSQAKGCLSLYPIPKIDELYARL